MSSQVTRQNLINPISLTTYTVRDLAWNRGDSLWSLMVDTGQHRECLLRSLACNCRTPYLSVLLAASCRKSIGKHQQPNATAGAEAAPSSVFDNNKKGKKESTVTSPPGWVWYDTRWCTGVIEPPPRVAVSRPAVSPVAGPLQSGGALRRPPRGRLAYLHLKVGTTVI